MITNLTLSRNSTRITWDYNGQECEFINSRSLTYGQAVDFVEALSEDEMQEMLKPNIPNNYVELLNMIL